MIEQLSQAYILAAKWLNDNQGVLGLGVFMSTLILGWFSGIFAALRRKPKFKLELLDGPTFCCTFPTGGLKENFPLHRTGFALYLSIANIGSAASSIKNISIGYHWHVNMLSIAGIKYRFGWFWLRHQTPAIHDFQAKIGENIKLYPFLMQASAIASTGSSTYFEPGMATNGVIYFEQPNSWGGCHPSPQKRGVRIKIAIRDVFGKAHTAKFWIQPVTLDDARKYNPSFGITYSELHNETLPHDASA